MAGQLSHRPVLLQEVVSLLAPSPAARIIDCTIGLGGHSEALLRQAGPAATLIGIDLDSDNLQRAKKRLETLPNQVRLFKANFSQLPQVMQEAGLQQADVVLADLGFASTQMDDPGRGLSFMAEGPLDMRLDRESGSTAADIINAYPEEELANLIYMYGEERYSRRIAKAIVAARKQGRIETTSQLAGIVAGAMPLPVRQARRGVHPATRTFQALRIAVNEELANLEQLLKLLPQVLAVAGRAGIISFHSLEDRRVKHAFADWARQGAARLLTKKPITPSVQESDENPRSRSAKFRGIERIL